MVDNLRIRQPLDRTKINLSESWEVEYWTKKWSITAAQLTAAVKAAGVQTAAVAKYLNKPV